MSTARRLARRLRAARRPGPEDQPTPRTFELERSAAQVRTCAAWVDRRVACRMLVPTDLIALQGAFRFASGWNPLVAAVDGGADVLRTFYAGHAPRSLAGMYWLDDDRDDDGRAASLPPWTLPWLYEIDRNLEPRPEMGLDASHGVSYYGPCTPDKVAVEVERLEGVASSVRERGYRPDESGDINGHFLLRGDEYRFFVRGGKHRAAVLAALGWSAIPVTFRPAWPRLVDRRDSETWPAVAAGSLSEATALTVFDRYFDWDGSQQRSRLLEAARLASTG